MVSRVDRGPVAEWFWTIDRFFLAAFIALMGIGLMLSFAASPAVHFAIQRVCRGGRSCRLWRRHREDPA